eukprot:4864379-Amphidinium_carterae.2
MEMPGFNCILAMAGESVPENGVAVSHFGSTWCCQETLGAPLCPCRHYEDKESEAPERLSSFMLRDAGSLMQSLLKVDNR